MAVEDWAALRSRPAGAQAGKASEARVEDINEPKRRPPMAGLRGSGRTERPGDAYRVRAFPAGDRFAYFAVAGWTAPCASAIVVL